MPAQIAKVLIFFAKTSNFSCKGVIFSSLELSTILLIFPFVLLSPTPIITAFPFPLIQSVPERIIGVTTFWVLLSLQSSYTSLLTNLLSPVKLLSSIFIPFPSNNKQSAGIVSPADIKNISPTNKSSAFKSLIILPRIVLKTVPAFLRLFNS